MSAEASQPIVPPVVEAPSSRTEAALEIENFIETYKIIADWIRFADTKAAATLTVNGVLLGLLIPTFKSYLDTQRPHPTSWWTAMVVVLFIGWLFGLLISASQSFLCIMPLRGLSRQLALSHTTHFHPAAVAMKFPLVDIERFVSESAAVGPAGLKREILAALLIDSHLSSTKYGYVARSIGWLGVSGVFGFVYMLAIQF